jgi:UDP-glucuronate 4-epimerase
MKKKVILVTGAAGFIGYHVSKEMMKKANTIVGIDNLNNYYDVNLKKKRLQDLIKISKKNKFNFFFYKIDLSASKALKALFGKYKFTHVINLAAQAGVRYSILNPESYVKSNLLGFSNIIQQSKMHKIKHFLYASTSSVYGNNTTLPFKESHLADHPMQFYAATKRSNELIAHAYSSLFKLPTTGLRFFTVYGPWGRPDMALYKFTTNIIKNKKIEVFNYGKHERDFTYVDDIAKSVGKLCFKIPRRKKNWSEKNPSSSNAPFEIFNIGNNKPVKLMHYIKLVEKNLNKKAKIKFLPIQPGDIKNTLSSNTKLNKYINYKPKISAEVGVKKFIDWYKDYYKKN